MIRRFATGAVCAGLVLALTGCGGTTDEGAGEQAAAQPVSAVQALNATSRKAAAVDSVKMEMTTESRLPQGQMTMRATMQTRMRPTVAMRMVVNEMSIGGQPTPGGKMETLLVDGAMYVKLPAELSQGGKPWTKISLSDVAKSSGMNLEQMLDQAQQQDLGAQTKLLTGSKDARKVGEETVEGVQTTHYTGTLTPREALAQLDPEQREAFKKLYAQLGQTKINFDVWVGADSLPRKMTNKLDTPQGPVTTTMLYRDFGAPVDVTAPPAAQVGDMKLPGA